MFQCFRLLLVSFYFLRLWNAKIALWMDFIHLFYFFFKRFSFFDFLQYSHAPIFLKLYSFLWIIIQIYFYFVTNFGFFSRNLIEKLTAKMCVKIFYCKISRYAFFIDEWILIDKLNAKSVSNYPITLSTSACNVHCRLF